MYIPIKTSLYISNRWIHFSNFYFKYTNIFERQNVGNWTLYKKMFEINKYFWAYVKWDKIWQDIKQPKI